MYIYCSDNKSVVSPPGDVKMITRLIHPWTRMKGWCLDNDIPAQYWFSTPVTMSGSHNRSCSCSHPGTHHTHIIISQLFLFIVSFSVIPLGRHVRLHTWGSSFLRLMNPLRPWGALRCGVLLWITPRHSRCDDSELCLIFDFYATHARHWEHCLIV